MNDHERKLARERMQRWRDRHPEVARANVRKSKLKVEFGLTPADYERMLVEQNGVCAICRRANRGKFSKNPLGVDHCHKTGRVRGLLCHQCNFAIGHAGDDPMVLRAAADYLEKHGQQLV